MSDEKDWKAYKVETGQQPSKIPLQNIPINTKEGRRIRQAFEGQGERVHVVTDFAQLEMRLGMEKCPKCKNTRWSCELNGCRS